MLLKKILKSTILSSIGGSSIFFLYKNDLSFDKFDFNNIGLIRFSRVGIAVNFH